MFAVLFIIARRSSKQLTTRESYSSELWEQAELSLAH